ncbi:response regulator [Acanthopleuribacter pedis]|uniref:Response regulator n=1 Tax=Acanthopleuribacter pedis TaxID=442870 RepID=A0A8J7Q888_9BACT|nr:response regulator [Acanthopleuribacter pedis]MBO1320251.1 response regulator [Acanthopleuribacter pedis]
MEPHERALLRLINDQLRQSNWERVRFLFDRLPQFSQSVAEKVLADLNDLAFKNGFPLLLSLLSKDPRLFRPNVYRLAAAKLYREPDTLEHIIGDLNHEEAEVLFHVMSMLPRENQLQKWNQVLVKGLQDAWMPLWAEALICAENPHARTALEHLSKHSDPLTAKIAAAGLGLNRENPDLVIEAENEEAKSARDQAEPLIYAVDDSRTILAMVKRLIKKLGYNCQGFESPAAALASFETDQPNLVITDLNMPDCNGMEFARRIRMLPLPQAPSVVLMTTTGENPSPTELEGAGIAQVIYKPINKNVLQMTLGEYLNTPQPT